MLFDPKSRAKKKTLKGGDYRRLTLIIVSLLCGWDALGIPMVCLGHLTRMAPTFLRNKIKRNFTSPPNFLLDPLLLAECCLLEESLKRKKSSKLFA
ncbi:hypothetical protein D0T87_14325 [Bacteroides sp. 51]|nr:hypothetical protein [Bacteroides sp. 51]